MVPPPRSAVPKQSTRRPAGWGPALSARRVGALIAINQVWQNVDGSYWRVAKIHREYDVAQLNSGIIVSVPFSILGKWYRPVDS